MKSNRAYALGAVSVGENGKEIVQMQEKKVTYQELARQAQKKEKHQIVLAIADGKIRELFQTAKEGEEISFLTTALTRSKCTS